MRVSDCQRCFGGEPGVRDRENEENGLARSAGFGLLIDLLAPIGAAKAPKRRLLTAPPTEGCETRCET